MLLPLHPAGADEEHLPAGDVAGLRHRGHVAVLQAGRGDTLPLVDRLHRLDLIAQLRRPLELRALRGLLHLPPQVVQQVLLLPLQEGRGLAHLHGVLLCRGAPGDARGGALPDVVIQTGTRQVARDLDGAGTQLEQFPDGADRPPHQFGFMVGIGSEVSAAVSHHLAGHHDLGEGLVRELDVRVGLVVGHPHVVRRPVALDQVDL